MSLTRGKIDKNTKLVAGTIIVYTDYEFDDYSISSIYKILKDFDLKEVHFRWNVQNNNKKYFEKWLVNNNYIEEIKYREVNSLNMCDNLDVELVK